MEEFEFALDLFSGDSGGGGYDFSTAISNNPEIFQDDYSKTGPVTQGGSGGGFNIGSYESQTTKMIKYGAMALVAIAVVVVVKDMI